MEPWEAPNCAERGGPSAVSEREAVVVVVAVMPSLASWPPECRV